MKSRRLFFRNAMAASVPLLLKPETFAFGNTKSQPILPEPEVPVLPSQAQQKWMDLKTGLFFHFGINTYYDMEWSEGNLDPSRFNPTQLNTDQWCETAKKAGMKYVVLTVKHHDGFCLWPSKFTSYSVQYTPFKKDVVKAFVESAKKYDLKAGLYYSLWDRHEKTHDTDENGYVEFMKNQLTELLTQYGPIVELWFDGFWKKQQSGWTKKKSEIEGEQVEAGVEKQRDEDFIAAWRSEGAYRWQMDSLYQYIKKLQPDCIVMNNSTTAYPGVPLHPVDARCGEKATGLKRNQNEWTWLGKKIFLPMQIETTMSVKGDKRFPSGNWFWHEWDHSVATKAQVEEWKAAAQKIGANLLINCPISDKGLLRTEDVEVLGSL